jgi:hypothetical protein
VIRALVPQVAEWFPSRSTITVECTNRSQAKEAEFAPICRGFSRELQRMGLQPGPAASVVSLTASESATGMLITARTVSGQRPRVAIAPWSMSQQTRQSAWRVTVERTPLLDSPTPVLDFALVADGSAIVMLEPAAVSVYGKTPAGWELTHRELLPVGKPPLRDPRGRLISKGAMSFTAYLPGAACTSADVRSQPFTCNDADAGWAAVPGVQVRWAPGRNYLQRENTSAYTISAPAPDRLLVSTLEGPLRLEGSHGEQLGVFAGFGSDVTAIEAPCGVFVMVTRAGDTADPDQVTAMDLRSGRMEAASPGLALPGPVTALWPSDDRTEAHAIVRNAGTGAYEVSRLAIHCAQ